MNLKLYAIIVNLLRLIPMKINFLNALVAGKMYVFYARLNMTKIILF